MLDMTPYSADCGCGGRGGYGRLRPIRLYRKKLPGEFGENDDFEIISQRHR